MDPQPLPWWRNGTILLNGTVALITALLAVLAVLQGAPEPWTASTFLFALIAGLNVLLRFLAPGPVAGSRAARSARALAGPRRWTW